MLEIALREGLAAALGKLRHAIGDEPREFPDLHLPGRVWSVAGHQARNRGSILLAVRAVDRTRLVLAAAGEVPIAVMRKIEGDPVQPGAERGVAAEAGECAVRPDEGVLDDLLYVGPIAQLRERHGEHSLAITRDDFDEGAFVAAVEAAHELSALQRLFGGGGHAGGAIFGVLRGAAGTEKGNGSDHVQDYMNRVAAEMGCSAEAAEGW